MDHLKFEVKRAVLKIGLLVALLVLGSLIAYNLYKPGISDDLSLADIISTMSAVLITVGLIYTAESLQLIRNNHETSEERARVQHSETLQLQRKMNAFAICEKFHDPEISHKILSAHNILKEHNDNIENAPHKFVRHLDENFDDRKIILSMLNYFEFVANSIIGDEDTVPSQSSFADEKTVRDSFKSLFVENFNKLKPVIEKKYKDDPRAYKSFLKVGEYWRKQ